MQAGLIGAWERLRHTLTATPAASGVYTLTATLQSRHARSLSDWYALALLQIVIQRDANGSAQTQFTAQFLGNTYTFTANNENGGTLRMEWIAPRWYMRAVGGEVECYLTWQGVEVYRGNTLVQSWSGGSYSVEMIGERYKAPAAVPLLWTQIGASATADYVPPDTAGAYSSGSSAQLQVSGGWEVRVGNQWQAFPVQLVIDPPKSAGCGHSLPYTPSMSAPDTANAHLTARAMAFYSRTGWQEASCFCVDSNGNPGTVPYVYRWRDIITESKSESNHVWLVPDLPREFELLSTEPIRALIYRAPLPKAEVIRSTQSLRFRLECQNDITCMETNADTVVRHPLTAEFLGVYGGGAHPLTQPLQGNLTAPYRWQAEWHYQHTRPNAPVLPGTCPNVPPEEPPIVFTTCMCPPGSPLRFQSDTKQVSAVLDYPSVSDDMLGYYQHQEPVARYINTWANPHWSYFLWFQNWSLGMPLTPVSRDDYWRPLQQQWLGDAALPEAERTKQRTLLCLEPLTVSPYTDWIADTLIGYPTLWAGVCRFDVLASPVQSQRVLTDASAPRWSASNATLTFNSGGIAVSPSAPTHTLEFDLTDWQVPPYLYPVLADSVRIAVSDPNAEVRVYLVDFAGETVLLDPHPSDSTRYPYRASAESIYAGSWAQSYAANLSGYSETGQDLLPAGRSALVMGDNARRTVWEMLGSRTPSKLRIVVSQDSPTDYTLEYPTFYRDTPSVSCAYPETAHTQAVVRGEQLWRHGGLEFRLTTPVPDLRPPHTAPTVYDALCLRNLLYHGRAYQDFMTADAMSLYDPEEWALSLAALRMETRALIRPLHQHTNSEPQWVLINAWREVPPLACLPRRRRDIDTLAENGDWGQWSYVLSPIRRYIVNPENYLHLHRVEYDSGGNETSRMQLTTVLATVSRYHITAHALALENDEVITDWSGQQVQSPRYLFHLNGRDYARATPFHGYSAVIVLIQGSPASAIEVDGRRAWLAWSRGAQLQTHHRVDYTQWLTRDYPAPILWLAWDSRRGVYLISLLDGSDGVVFSTADGGATYTEVLRMTATRLVAESHSITGVWVALAHNGTATLRRISLDGGASWSAPTQPMLDGQPMTAVPYALAYDERSHALLLTAEQDDEWFVAVSYDLGATWSTVLT